MAARLRQIRQDYEARLGTLRAQIEKVKKDLDFATAHDYAKDSELVDGASTLSIFKARLKKVNKDLGSATAQDDVKDCQVVRGAEITRAQERRIRDLEGAAQEILSDQTKTRLTMTELRADLQKLNLAFTNNNDRLALQIVQSDRREITIQNLRADNAQLLEMLVAESARSHIVADHLPNTPGGVLGDEKNVRIFLGVEGAETVLIRAQRMMKEQEGVFIVESGNHTRTVLHRRLGECKVDMHGWDWYLRLGAEPNRAQVEFRIDHVDPYDLEEWLKEV